MIEEKERFLLDEFQVLAIDGAFQRGNIYKKSLNEKEKESFKEELRQKLQEISERYKNKRIIKEDPSRKFVGLVEDIAARMYKIYGPRLGEDYGFQALVCHKPDSGRPWLFSLDQSGCASEITTKQVYCIIGSGYDYGHLFIKSVYPQYGDMEGVAIVSAFVIHLIDAMDIDSSIGPDEKGNVQVWFFPNDAEPYEAKGQSLKKIVDEAKKRLTSFADFLVLGKTRN